MSKKQYWMSPLDDTDDFGQPYNGIMIDGKTKFGPWANMSEKAWALYSGTKGKLGLGLGQKYQKQPDGRWLKIEG